MRSIHQRLTLGLTLVLGFLLLGQWLWLTLTIDQLIQKQVLTRLQEESESLLANIHLGPEGQIMLDERKLSSSYQRAFSGHYFQLQSSDETVFSRSLWDETLPVKLLTTGARQQQYLSGPQQQPLLVVSAGFQKQQQQITITVAEDIAWMLADKKQFQLVFTLLSAAGLLLLLLLQTRIIHHALKPLTKARRQLQQISHGERDSIDEQAPDEIRPLLLELNRLMNSMVTKTRRSRQALGNLAHRLKTELSLLNQIAEQKSDDQPALERAIHEQTGQLRRIIDRELKRARVAGMSLPGQRIDLNAMLRQLTETLQLIYRDKALSIDWSVTAGARYDGDREDFLELLGNLMDNACKWCDSEVCVTLSQDKGLKIVVEDDGPGCDAEKLSVLTQRGFRADESVPGSGLGLAIVYDIVDSYNGKIDFATDQKMRGLQVSVTLQTTAT